MTHGQVPQRRHYILSKQNDTDGVLESKKLSVSTRIVHTVFIPSRKCPICEFDVDVTSLDAPESAKCVISITAPFSGAASYKNDVATSGSSSSAWAAKASARSTLAREAGPPRQILTASGGLPVTVKESLATTPIPVARM